MPRAINLAQERTTSRVTSGFKPFGSRNWSEIVRAIRSGAQLLYIQDLPLAATRIGSSARGKSSHGRYRISVTPSTRAPAPPIQIKRRGQVASRRAQGTIKNNPTRPVVYLIKALSPTHRVPSSQ